MDPVSALGAAGSVFGIAAFALKLHTTISKLYTQIASVPAGLVAILEELKLTAAALKHINELLETEQRQENNGKPRLLVSSSALDTIRETANKCLLVFWRIEGTITDRCNTDKQSEDQLERRLVQYKEEVQNRPVSSSTRALLKLLHPTSSESDGQSKVSCRSSKDIVNSSISINRICRWCS